MREQERLGPYVILSPLGAGGMGEVWRAEDTRIGREVALKALPESFADDPERRARFEREARTLAALNHSNIATLYGLELLDGKHLLVMELVEGEGLDEILARGPLPVDETRLIAVQIAEALEAAHEAGIVHRDLKPANVRIRPDGTVKVLDFGLAKAWSEDGDVDLSHSPTLTRHATAAGILLGTAAYMSPEQARGKPVDRRADIWAFGVVLWEMLTGRQLFTGETVSDILAAVLREVPPVEILPDDLPRAFRRVLVRCLERDPRRRLQWIGDARVELEEGGEEEPSEIVAAATPAPRRALVPWLLAAAAAVSAAALAVVLLIRTAPARPVLRFQVPPPAGGSFELDPDSPGPAVISPDGRTIAFSARGSDGIVRLWVRSLDTVEPRSLGGTEGAAYPFWSPDSRRVAFFADGRLQTVDTSGGPPLTLCAAQEGKGGSWGSKGVIVFAPSYNTGLSRVSAAGGEPTPVTELDAARHDSSHRHPRFLPDGEHFLYMIRSPSEAPEGHLVGIGSIDGSSRLLPLRSPAVVEYASGHLLYPRGRTLMAQPFDAAHLRFTGAAFPVTGGVTLLPSGTVAGVYSASQNGVLVYQMGRWFGATLQMAWHDRKGRQLGTVGSPDAIYELTLLPDGSKVLYGVTPQGSANQDLWILDLGRGVASRFTFSGGDEFNATPSPDGRTVYYGTEDGGKFTLRRKELAGSGTSVTLLEGGADVYPNSVSADGGTLVFTRGGDETRYDLWSMPADGRGKPSPLIKTPFNEQNASLSPDGRWLIYQSDESGQDEVYLTSYPELGRKWQVSSGGGALPQWASSGAEIVYQNLGGVLYSATFTDERHGPVVGRPSELFDAGLGTSRVPLWAPAPDGRRILVAEPVMGHDPSRLTVEVNWLSARDVD